MSMIRNGALALLVLPPMANAFAGGGGHFRKGEVRLQATHVIAVLRDEDPDPASAETLVYLSDVPLDADKLAAVFDASGAAEEQLGEGSAGYVRICIDAEGSECGLYFSHNQPSASFNSSGYGAFELEQAPAGRIAGRWLLAEPNDFFGETYDFDLRFDVAVVHPPGKPLPADGGEPGQAYRRWSAAVAKGDMASLRALAGEDYAWRLGSDEASDVKTALKDLRDGTPIRPEILRGRSDGDEAILWVRGTDRDDILRAGRVQLKRDTGGWRYSGADLESVDE